MPTASKSAYISHAWQGAKIWLEVGAATGPQFDMDGGKLIIGGVYPPTLQSGHVNIGASSTGNAEAVLYGGSWITTDDMGVGNAGNGTLTLAWDATASVGNNGLFIAYASGSTGALNIGELGGGTGGHLTLTGAGGAVIFGSGTGTINFNQDGTFTLSAPIVGTGALKQLGSGTTILAADNTGFTGTTTISAGTLQIGNGGTTGTLPGNITNNGALKFNRSTNLTYDGVISGSGSLAAVNTTLILAADQGYTGGTTVSGGRLQIGNGGSTGSVQGNIGTVNNGQVLFYRSNDQTYTGVVSGSGYLTKDGPGTLTLTGNHSYSSVTSTMIGAGAIQVGNGGATGALPGNIALVGSSQVRFNRSDNPAYAGVISGTGQLFKLGTGSLVLSGANTYSGTTSVSAGTLVVNGSIVNSPTSVGAGATLAGSGTVGPVTVNASGVLAPGGTAASMLTTGNLTQLSGSSLQVDLLGTTAGSSYDQLNVNGTATLAGNLVVNLGFLPPVGQTFTIVSKSGATPATGTFTGLAQGAFIDTGGARLQISYTGGTGNDVTLTTIATRPSAPSITSVTPGNGQITVAFAPGAANASPITGYTATCGGTSAVGAGSPIVVAGLANATPYTCTVAATNAFGSTPSAASGSVTPFTVPGASPAPTATPGDTNATVNFSAPTFNGGAAITGHTATAAPGGITGTCSAPCTSIVVNGLTNGTAYTFTVTATNAAGTGPASAASNSVTPRLSQTITFANPGPRGIATAPTLAAIASSGLAVSFSSPTTTICTITSGGTLSFHAPGNCTVNADQAGNATYLAAARVTHSFAVTPYTSFATATRYAIGAIPTSAALGDFNGDGKPDVAVVRGGAGVSILLNNGDGSFQAAVNFAVFSPTTLATGDFNGDGKLDLAVGGGIDVWMLLGNGDGTLGTATLATAFPGSVTAVAAADFNGDGKLDLTAADGIAVSILPGNGDGTVAPRVAYGGGGSAGIVVADFNQDGKADLAVAVNGGGMRILLGVGDGTFLVSVVGMSNVASTGFAVGDFDGDGKLDIAFFINPEIYWFYRGNGNGTFASGVAQMTASMNQTPTAHSVADFDGDGHLDLAARNGSAFIVRGRGDGTFGLDAPISTGGTGTGPIAVGDLNGDCRPDLALGNSGSYDVSILLNTSLFRPGVPAIGGAAAAAVSASVAFTAPVCDGGTPITTYTAVSSPGGFTGSCTAPCTSIVVNGLTNGTAYTFTVTATNAAGTGPASATSNGVTPKASQAITFANPGAQSFGTTPTLSAAASSGLAVSFSSSTSAICTITSGGTLSFLAAGTCSVNADQAGNAAYLAAPTVTQSFLVALSGVLPGAPTIGAAIAGNGQVTVAFMAPVSDGGSAILDYTATCGTTTATGAASPLVVTGLANGTAVTCTVVARNAIGTGPASATSNSVTPTSSQTITFANPGAQSFGTTPTLAATASSGLAVSFSSSTAAICTITSGGTLSFLAAGTCTVNADQAGNVAYLAAPTVTQSFPVALSGVVPGAPAIGAAIAGNGQVTVAFTPPAFDGGSAILDYTATCGTTTATGAASPLVVTGLANGTAVTCTVVARNAIGTGPPSAPSNSVAPGAGAGADLAITQSATPNPGNAGRDIVYTLTTSNTGLHDATGVLVVDTLPAGATFVWASPGCTVGPGTVACAVGTLASGASVEHKVVLRTGVGNATNNVSVSATQPDPNAANNSSSLAVPVNATPPASQVQRYRLYSDITKEHHFTTDLNEYNVLGTFVGTWVQEGTVGKVLDNPGQYNGVTAVPYYRLYDNNTRWHHWTTDANEYYTLGFVYSGWNMEGVDGYILPSAAAGTTQLYRLNYPPLGALHHWTIDQNEYTTLITPQYGWVGEGGSGFVIFP